ncbi:NUDIX hydrolase [Kitasatospora sp. NPDC052896]|uniref:NUDIX hydrolase n=1 Tax=Kitasatospora sp. NPDC052896 TaxID=3364061 RepID=UPI0037C96F23
MLGGPVEDDEEARDALRRELLEESSFDRAALPSPPRLRFLQDQETPRPGGSGPFPRRHLVFTAHLPDHLVEAVARTEQDNIDQAPVVWRSAADAVGRHLHPAIGDALDQVTRPGTTTGGPLLLRALTGASYQRR